MLNLLSEHLDIWTGAPVSKANGGRGRVSAANRSPYGIKKLRELILELAVRGKLVAQDPNDEPASVLLERIAKEKTRLVKEGKIKKQKPLPEISEEEKPFDLPEEWEWVKLQNVSVYIQRGKGPKYAEHGYVRVVSQKCVQWSGFDLSRAQFVDDNSLGAYQAERFLQKNDLLWNSTGTGTVGRVNVLGDVEPNKLVADSHVTVIRLLKVNSEFLRCYVAAPGIQLLIEPGHENALVSGTTNQVELNTSSVLSLIVPVPPLAEQHRIVAKVDELMALCDRLEQQQGDSSATHQTLVETLLATLTAAADHQEFAEAWHRIAGHFDTLFTTEESIDQLKQAILQLAVQGKLVPQDPNDEPAEDSNDSEDPFDLPQNWSWKSLSEVGICRTGKTPPTSESANYGAGFPFIGPGQITFSGVILPADKEITALGLSNSTEAIADDILMVCIGGSIGKAAICRYTLGFNQQINSIRSQRDCPAFLCLALISGYFQDQVFARASGSATPIINKGKWEQIRIPLPPLAEQRRIVAKVDELMALVDELETQLAASRATGEKLLVALVAELTAGKESHATA